MTRLGFYHDDWALLQQMIAHGGGLAELIAFQLRRTVHLYRPLSVLCWTLPYWFFGLRPLGWHLLMTALTGGLGAALYSILREHGASELNAVLAALIFMAFPNADATLFWPDVAMILSMSLLCFLLAYREHLRYMRDGLEGARWRSAALLFLSLCAYEQPFFLLPIWLFAPGGGVERSWRMRRSLALGAAAVVIYALYKFALVPQFVPYNKPVSFSARHALFVCYMALRAVADPRWIFYLLQVAWRGVHWHPLLALGALLTPAAAWRALDRENASGSAKTARTLIFWGGSLYALAYVPFFFSDYAPAAYDHMNRLNQLPAIGLAALACGWAAVRPGKLRTAALAVVAAFCLITSTAFAEIWAQSYRRQLAVRDAVLAHEESWPPHQLLLIHLDELYVARKAPVFLAGYDVASAIAIWTGRQDRDAVVYTQWTHLGLDALQTQAGSVPYGSVSLLDMANGRIEKLDRRRARALPPPMDPWETPLRFW